MNEKSILVTGGAGFIGFNFIIKCLKLGYKIFNIDTLSYSANLTEIKKLNHESHLFYNLNISDQKIFKILKKNKISKIVNFAAETHVDNSIKKPKFFFKNNCMKYIDFIFNIKKYYDTLSSNDQKYFKFINISTDEVYGSLKLNQKPFDEKSILSPRNPYSASKASAEMYLQSFSNTFGLPYIITNCSNNYGKYQNDEKLIPTIFRKAIQNKKIPIYGNGKNIREWIHVDDHNNAILALLKKGKNYDKYNIGSKNELTNLEIVNKICLMLDKKIPKKNSFKKQIKFVKDRLGHDFRYSINSKKIKKEIGWKSKIDIDLGLESISDYYIKKYQSK